MILRRLAALVMLGLSAWLFYDGLRPVLLIVDNGSDLMSALFAPPTSAIRLMAAAIMMVGGGLAAFRVKSGGSLALTGSLLFTALGGLMAASGAQQVLWLDEVLYGVGAIGVAVLMLTLRRIQTVWRIAFAACLSRLRANQTSPFQTGENSHGRDL